MGWEVVDWWGGRWLIGGVGRWLIGGVGGRFAVVDWWGRSWLIGGVGCGRLVG